MNYQSRVSHLSLAPLVNHVEHVCLEGLGCFVIEPCECVFVWSHMYLSIIHTLSHFLLKLWWLDSPLTTRPSPCFWLNRLSSKTMQMHQDSLFKICCPQAIQSTLMLATQTVGPRSQPEIDSPKKLCRGHWNYLLSWLRKLRRQVRQTPSAHLWLTQKIMQLS